MKLQRQSHSHDDDWWCLGPVWEGEGVLKIELTGFSVGLGAEKLKQETSTIKVMNSWPEPAGRIWLAWMKMRDWHWLNRFVAWCGESSISDACQESGIHERMPHLEAISSSTVIDREGGIPNAGPKISKEKGLGRWWETSKAPWKGVAHGGRQKSKNMWHSRHHLHKVF